MLAADSDTTLLIDTVRDAGALALGMFRTDFKTWIKGESSPVSEADIAVNDLLEARLRSARPDYGWLSEETQDDGSRLSSEWTWIIDPIDGTRSFINGQKDWSICVALAKGGRPMLGAVFAPASDDFYFAARSGGAKLNDNAIDVAEGRDLYLPKIAGPKTLLGRLSDVAEGTTGYPRIGSLALRLCRVADGRIEAALVGGNSRDWDLAAADLIVHEAGGLMTDISGAPLSYNRASVVHGVLVASGQERHRRLVEHLAD